MRRCITGLLVAVVVACSAASEPTTTTAQVTTSTTTVPTTTTIPATTTTVPPTTTTTMWPITGADQALRNLIEALYAVTNGGQPPPVSEQIGTAFAAAAPAPPPTGTASVADWDETTRLAVVQTGRDITLAARDPEWRIVGGWWPSLGIGPHLGSYPKLLAVVGSDARKGQNRNQSRADSIHFVGLDAEGGAGVLGVPRDSWVPIPGSGRSRINAALVFGGPDLMMETFESVSDLDFDGFLLTGFGGFEGMVGVLGGLAMNVPHDFDDSAAKADLEAGEQVLDPEQALALSRTRKTLARGDFERQANGGLVLMAAQAMLRSGGALQLPQLVAGARPHLTTDLAPWELLQLAAAIIRADPARTVNDVVPGGAGRAGSASVVFLSPGAEDLFDDLADGNLGG